MKPGVCACGCGRETTIARHNSKYGAIKGEPLRFAPGHWNRIIPSTETFWPKVERTAGCWLWQGLLDREGYGVYASGRAHRFAYEDQVGPIPDGLVLDHLCCVRNCVNPSHLEPVTNAENVRRVAERSPACRRGHEWTPENTYWYRGTRRQCRACGRARAAAYQARKRSAAA